MGRETLELILAALLLCSYMAMPHHAYELDGKRHKLTFLQYFRFFTISDYIVVTRRENGTIGGWFWTFIISAVLLVFVSMINIVADDERACMQVREAVPQELFPIL